MTTTTAEAIPVAETNRERDPALEAAWRTYFDYDTISNLQRRTERLVRLLLLISGMLAGLLAILSLNYKTGVIQSLLDYYYTNTSSSSRGGFDSRAELTIPDLPIPLKYGMIAAALLFFVLAVYWYMNNRTNVSVERLAYRLCSILIIREIYLYRVGAGRYFATTRTNAQRMLKQSVDAAEKRVAQMGVRPAPKTMSIAQLAESIRKRVYPYQEDGFGPLTIPDYIQWRTQSTREYYVSVSQTVERQTGILYLVVGGLLFAGVFFAVIQMEVFVLGTLILSFGLNMYIEFSFSKRVARVFYEPAASQVDAELESWNLMPPEQQTAENAARFAERVENIIQFEGEMFVLSSVFSSTHTNINQQVLITDLMQNGLSLLSTNNQSITPIRYAKNSIFISYRRSDSADIVGRIQDRLSIYFGRDTIFRDVDTIAVGQEFEKRILTAIGQCRVMLVVIGPDWENALDIETKQRRLLDPADYVRREIAAALQRPEVIVVPLLVRGAMMPDRNQLPSDCQDLTFRNGLQIRNDPDFDADIKRLINAIEISAQE